MTGRFITIEGQDGAGKTSNLKTIERTIVDQGLPVLVTFEPGGTKLGEQIRQLVLHSDLSIDAMSELLLIFAARAQHLSEVIEPALAKGTWVLCDRFTDATYAYQGGGRGIETSTIEILENLVQGQRRPDLTILLDVDVKTGQSRASSRSDPDRFESEADRFKQAVRDVYLERSELFPNRIVRVDATQTLDVVNETTKQIITDFIETL